ncbi:MAG: ribonuclease HII [Clostridiales Family XIII bacterium]|jgi:ribonuclease HII|nr:ribonuclease HII [Clostridiales Family XIII bacterium]
MKKAEREEYLKNRLVEMQVYERALREKGTSFIGGVDEVGRGPLAGPVCAACVVLPEDFDVLGVDDSKKVTEKKRNELYGQIIERAICWGVGFVDNHRIDEINILNATKEAMLAAINEANEMLRASSGAKIEHLLIDAVKLPEAGIHGTAIIKGDAKSTSIAAASIVAKVTRDRIMIEMEQIYPGYSFASNKGYGTKAHYEGLREFGPTPIHRRTFL